MHPRRPISLAEGPPEAEAIELDVSPDPTEPPAAIPLSVTRIPSATAVAPEAPPAAATVAPDAAPTIANGPVAFPLSTITTPTEEAPPPVTAQPRATLSDAFPRISLTEGPGRISIGRAIDAAFTRASGTHDGPSDSSSYEQVLDAGEVLRSTEETRGRRARLTKVAIGIIAACGLLCVVAVLRVGFSASEDAVALTQLSAALPLPAPAEPPPQVAQAPDPAQPPAVADFPDNHASAPPAVASAKAAPPKTGHGKHPHPSRKSILDHP